MPSKTEAQQEADEAFALEAAAATALAVSQARMKLLEQFNRDLISAGLQAPSSYKEQHQTLTEEVTAKKLDLTTAQNAANSARTHLSVCIEEAMARLTPPPGAPPLAFPVRQPVHKPQLPTIYIASKDASIFLRWRKSIDAYFSQVMVTHPVFTLLEFLGRVKAKH